MKWLRQVVNAMTGQNDSYIFVFHKKCSDKKKRKCRKMTPILRFPLNIFSLDFEIQIILLVNPMLSKYTSNKGDMNICDENF